MLPMKVKQTGSLGAVSQEHRLRRNCDPATKQACGLFLIVCL